MLLEGVPDAAVLARSSEMVTTGMRGLRGDDEVEDFIDVVDENEVGVEMLEDEDAWAVVKQVVPFVLESVNLSSVVR